MANKILFTADKVAFQLTERKTIICMCFVAGHTKSLTTTPLSSLPCAVMQARNILGYSQIGNQSERAKNTIHWFGICMYLLFVTLDFLYMQFVNVVKYVNRPPFKPAFS